MLETVFVDIKKLIPSAIIPTQSKKGDAGYDLYSAENCIISPFGRRLVRTGIAIAIPEGYYGRIAPRSGLALKHGIDVMGGVVDCFYRGEVGVILVNLACFDTVLALTQQDPKQAAYQGLFGNREDFKIRAGDRIAQLIIEKCHEVSWREAGELSTTERNQGGFGHTGI